MAGAVKCACAGSAFRARALPALPAGWSVGGGASGSLGGCFRPWSSAEAPLPEIGGEAAESAARACALTHPLPQSPHHHVVRGLGTESQFVMNTLTFQPPTPGVESPGDRRPGLRRLLHFPQARRSASVLIIVGFTRTSCARGLCQLRSCAPAALQLKLRPRVSGLPPPPHPPKEDSQRLPGWHLSAGTP